MKTKLTKLTFALFAVMVWTSVNAQTSSGSCGYPNAADVTWSYDNGTLTFTGTGAMNMYSEDYPQAPWYSAYSGTTTKVVVGEGITTIPHWAFAMFEHLTSVSLPNTLTTIGKAAFEECAFTTINLPEGLETIGDYAFQMTPLTSVTIPSTVTSIGEVAFQANDALIYVNCLATTPPTMDGNVFQACGILMSIYVPATNVATYKGTSGWSTYYDLINSYIGGSCGANATWQYLEDQNNMIISGTGAMTDYSSLMTDIPWIAYQTSISQVTIGDEITHVGNWAFQGCTDLRSVVIGENVTSIGNGSFDNCTNAGFTKLNIPNSVQTIGIDAFSNNHLKYVCLGSGLTSIGAEAFMMCSDLEYIGCYASTPPTIGTEAFMGCSALATIYVPSAKIGDYTAASGWSDYAAMIQSPAGTCGTSATWSFEMATRTLTIEGTGAINDYTGWDSNSGEECFSFNPYNSKWYPYGIKNVVIDEGITEIPNSAFYMEVGITDVTLPSTLTAIATDAFGECENIETITCNATAPPTLGDGSAGSEDYVFYVPNEDGSAALPIPTVSAVYVPAASVDTYKAAAGWSAYDAKIQGYNNILTANTAGDGVYWATYYNGSANIQVAGGTKVYKGKINGSKIDLTEVADGIITTGNAVVLKSTGSKIALCTAASASADDYSNNDLKGGTSVEAGKVPYTLANGTNGVGFYKYTGALDGNKAHLEIASGSSAPEFFGFDDTDVQTSIENAQCSIVNVQSDVWYTITGVKLNGVPTSKGVFINNGRKVVIK